MDSHLVLPRIADGPEELEKDLAPFRSLAGRVPAVMVSHAATGSGSRPATLDPETATGLLRRDVGFEGIAISDDLEMGALAEFGGIAERAFLAFEAGCDLLCVGKDTAALPEAAEAIERGARASRRDEAEGRLGEFRETLRRPEPPVARRRARSRRSRRHSGRLPLAFPKAEKGNAPDRFRPGRLEKNRVRISTGDCRGSFRRRRRGFPSAGLR